MNAQADILVRLRGVGTKNNPIYNYETLFRLALEAADEIERLRDQREARGMCIVYDFDTETRTWTVNERLSHGGKA
jgi:hypothetical protein